MKRNKQCKKSMKGYFIITLLMAQAINVFSQERSTWKHYYSLVDSAEQAIIVSSDTNALTYYSSAFNMVNNPYPEDLHNALLCAVKVNNFDLSIKYAKELVAAGTTLEELEDNKHLEPLINSNEWKVFQKEYSSIHNKFLKSKNAKLDSLMDYVLWSDQYYARKRTQMGYEDSLFYAVFDNVKSILAYSNKYEYPNRVDYGLALVHFFQLQYRFNDKRFFDSTKRVEYIEKGYDYNSINLDSIQIDMVLQGKFYPKYLYWASPTLLLQIDDSLALINYSDSIINRLDSLREIVGLSDMATYLKKGLFQLKIDGFRYKYPGETTEEYLNSWKTADGNFFLSLCPAFSMFFVKEYENNKKIFEEEMRRMQDPDVRKKFRDYVIFKEIPRPKIRYR